MTIQLDSDWQYLYEIIDASLYPVKAYETKLS